MATSGSTDYSETLTTIISDALINIGVLAAGETPEHDVSEFARRQLNRMIKAWQGEGYNLWRATEGEITLVADQQSYTMGGTAPDFAARPLRIEFMRFTQSDGTEAPRMIPMSREDYFHLPNKNAQGTSTQFYYDPQRDQGKLYIWPVLAAISSTPEKLKFTYQRAFEDFDSGGDEPDIPQEWFNAIVLNLAKALCTPNFPGKLELKADIKADAKEALDLAKEFDVEWADVEFVLAEDRR